jgi:hypothetical protein
VLTVVQVSRMAIELTVRLRLRRSHHLLMVDHIVLVLVRRRLGPYWLPHYARIPGRYVRFLLRDNYTDCRVASTLDRYELPFFGPLATSITDDE